MSETTLEDRAKKFLDVQSYGSLIPETRRLWTAWLMGFADKETAELKVENERLKVALADAIRRPMDVVPDSAQGLVTQDEVQTAEERRFGIEENKDAD